MLNQHRDLIFTFVQLSGEQTGEIRRLALIARLGHNSHKVGALEKYHARMIDKISRTDIAGLDRFKMLNASG